MATVTATQTCLWLRRRSLRCVRMFGVRWPLASGGSQQRSVSCRQLSPAATRHGDDAHEWVAWWPAGRAGRSVVGLGARCLSVIRHRTSPSCIQTCTVTGAWGPARPARLARTSARRCPCMHAHPCMPGSRHACNAECAGSITRRRSIHGARHGDLVCASALRARGSALTASRLPRLTQRVQRGMAAWAAGASLPARCIAFIVFSDEPQRPKQRAQHTDLPGRGRHSFMMDSRWAY